MKEDSSELLFNFIRKLEKHSMKTVKKVHTDNGTDFMQSQDYIDKQRWIYP